MLLHLLYSGCVDWCGAQIILTWSNHNKANQWHASKAPVRTPLGKKTRIHTAVWWPAGDNNILAPSNNILIVFFSLKRQTISANIRGPKLNHRNEITENMTQPQRLAAVFPALGDQIAFFSQIIPIMLTEKNSKWTMLQDVGHSDQCKQKTSIFSLSTSLQFYLLLVGNWSFCQNLSTLLFQCLTVFYGINAEVPFFGFAVFPCMWAKTHPWVSHWVLLSWRRRSSWNFSLQLFTERLARLCYFSRRIWKILQKGANFVSSLLYILQGAWKMILVLQLLCLATCHTLFPLIHCLCRSVLQFPLYAVVRKNNEFPEWKERCNAWMFLFEEKQTLRFGIVSQPNHKTSYGRISRSCTGLRDKLFFSETNSKFFPKVFSELIWYRTIHF